MLEMGRQIESWLFSKVIFLRMWDITASLRIGWNWPELRERLTMLVIVGIRTEAQDLTSQSHSKNENLKA